jgi:hypothetical protein
MRDPGSMLVVRLSWLWIPYCWQLVDRSLVALLRLFHFGKRRSPLQNGAKDAISSLKKSCRLSKLA